MLLFHLMLSKAVVTVVSAPKRVPSSLPKMNSDTGCDMLGGESVRRRGMGVGRSHSNFEKSSVKAG